MYSPRTYLLTNSSWPPVLPLLLVNALGDAGDEDERADGEGIDDDKGVLDEQGEGIMGDFEAHPHPDDCMAMDSFFLVSPVR